MRQIHTRQELLELKRELRVRDDWHEPDEQGITATVTGRTFDNAGFWPVDHLWAESREIYVQLRRFEDRQGVTVPGKVVAVVNLATLFAWATGYESALWRDR